MTDTDKRFQAWCVVEIMGHRKFAGFVSEETIGGASFVRVDVPAVTHYDGTELPAFTKLFGAGSIYCLTPCTEDTARAFASQLRQRAFEIYEAPRLPAPQDTELFECASCFDAGLSVDEFTHRLSEWGGHLDIDGRRICTECAANLRDRDHDDDRDEPIHDEDLEF